MPDGLQGAQVACSRHRFHGTKIRGILVFLFLRNLSSTSTTSCLKTKFPEAPAGRLAVGWLSALLCHCQLGGGHQVRQKTPTPLSCFSFPQHLCAPNPFQHFQLSESSWLPQGLGTAIGSSTQMLRLRLGQGASLAQGRTANRART